MTDRQKTALAFPGARAMDTARPCFRQLHTHRRKPTLCWSTILTVAARPSALL